MRVDTCPRTRGDRTTPAFSFFRLSKRFDANASCDDDKEDKKVYKMTLSLACLVTLRFDHQKKKKKYHKKSLKAPRGKNKNDGNMRKNKNENE